MLEIREIFEVLDYEFLNKLINFKNSISSNQYYLNQKIYFFDKINFGICLEKI